MLSTNIKIVKMLSIQTWSNLLLHMDITKSDVQMLFLVKNTLHVGPNLTITMMSLQMFIYHFI